MSITSTHLLAIAESLVGSIALATNIDWSIPSPFKFNGKEDFFAAYDDSKDTKTEIETTLIRAAWLRYLTFEDIGTDDENARELDGPVKELVYEITVFHELKPFQRLDETVTPDAFNKQILKTNHEHVTAIMALCGEFQGVNSVADLLTDFAVAETISLAQTDSSEHNVECEFIPGVTGDQTKLEARIRVQLPC